MTRVPAPFGRSDFLEFRLNLRAGRLAEFLGRPGIVVPETAGNHLPTERAVEDARLVPRNDQIHISSCHVTLGYRGVPRPRAVGEQNAMAKLGEPQKRPMASR